MNNQEQKGEDLQSTNDTQRRTDTPVRSEQQLEIIRQLIEQATRNGTVRVLVQVRNLFKREELLRQLAPFQPEILSKHDAHLALQVNAAAITYLRDSNLVESIGRDMLLYPSTTELPARTPQELAYFQKAIDTALRNGTARVTVGLNVSFTPEGGLTPEQRAAQRAAISLTQDELLRQLIPYQARLLTRFDIVPYLTLDVDATALIFMRDSRIALNVRENGLGTVYPTRRNRKKRQFVIYQ